MHALSGMHLNRDFMIPGRMRGCLAWLHVERQPCLPKFWARQQKTRWLKRLALVSSGSPQAYPQLSGINIVYQWAEMPSARAFPSLWPGNALAEGISAH